MPLNLELFESVNSLLIAVSGGRDSVGLLTRLLEQRQNLPEMAIVYVDHRLRKESEREKEFVENLAGENRLPFFSKTLPEIPRGETAARELRYRCLVEAACDCGAGAVVTAHHRKDQTESILLNLLRGTSLRGLLGMPESRLLSDQILLLRPALSCFPEELHFGVEKYCEDASNLLANNPRNILRLEILPALDEVFPRSIDDAFNSFSRQVREDLAALEFYVPDKDILSYEDFLSLPRAVQKRWLRRHMPLETAQVERGLQAVSDRRSCDLGQGLYLNIGRDTVSIEKREPRR
jgi:tRNA(Ile)-lysidine synthase